MLIACTTAFVIRILSISSKILFSKKNSLIYFIEISTIYLVILSDIIYLIEIIVSSFELVTFLVLE